MRLGEQLFSLVGRVRGIWDAQVISGFETEMYTVTFSLSSVNSHFQ